MVTVKEIFGNIWPKRAAKGQALIITKPFAPKGALHGGKYIRSLRNDQRRGKSSGNAAKENTKTKAERTLVITASPSFDLLFSFPSCLIEAAVRLLFRSVCE